MKDTTVDGVEAKVDKSRVASLISRGEDGAAGPLLGPSAHFGTRLATKAMVQIVIVFSWLEQPQA